MNTIRTLLLRTVLTLTLTLPASPLSAAGGAKGGEDIETKLRETLRDTMIQLRDVQNTNAILQAEKDVAEAKVVDLTAKLDKAVKEAIAERNVATNQIGELTQKLSAAETRILDLETAVSNWKKAFEDAAGLAQQKEGERAALERKRIELERVTDEQISKNLEMYRIAMELLTRYRKYSLGDAIVAREPFFGVSKVQLENIMQDYHNQLRDQRIIPAGRKKPGSEETGGGEPN